MEKSVTFILFLIIMQKYLLLQPFNTIVKLFATLFTIVKLFETLFTIVKLFETLFTIVKLFETLFTIVKLFATLFTIVKLLSSNLNLRIRPSPASNTQALNI